MKLSVIVATYNRPALVERLLRQLAGQTLSPEAYEVHVVDDGSSPPVGPRLRGLEVPYALRLHAQPNGGAARARHTGALAARGELLLFVDDDMQVGPDFLATHLRAHETGGGRRVVQGRIRPDPGLRNMPLFERWQAWQAERMWQAVRGGRTRADGVVLYSGNVSLRREDYLEAGGFDAAFAQGEDGELGLRLEKRGCTFSLVEEAWTLHGSDHTSLAAWRQRAMGYGVYGHREGRKHAEVRDASPWRFLWEDKHPAFRPFLAATVVAPEVGRAVATAAVVAARLLDGVGLEKPALAGMSLAFAMEYFRGVRQECGSLGQAVGELSEWVARFDQGGAVPLARMVADLREDHALLRHHDAKYGHRSPSSGTLAADVVQRMGLQMMASYRLMRMLCEAGQARAAQVVSRLMRHLYGADVHWEARLAPGVVIVHGMGLTVSHAARVGRGSVLCHGVTLGMGTDPVTRRAGAPVLGRNVHVGPGAQLIGPIVVGDGSKIMPGVVLMQSVPPGSLVRGPGPQVQPRRRPEGNEVVRQEPPAPGGEARA